jgi:endonuclease/exonuclease/phosphatase family metal-dependent hydrolase
MVKADQIKLTDSWPHCSYGVRTCSPIFACFSSPVLSSPTHVSGQDGFTFNSADPTERIDYAFFAARGSDNGKVSCRAGVRNTQASDHRPLFVSYPLL